MKYNYKGNLAKFADITTLLGMDTNGMTAEESAAAAGEYITQLNREIGISEHISTLGVKKEQFHIPF